MAPVRDEQYYLNMGSDRFAMLLLKKTESKFLYPGSVLLFLWIILSLGTWDTVFFGYVPENFSILMLATAAWILWTFYYLLLAIFHEVFVMNDQLAGRAPEFKKLIHPNGAD